MLEAPLTSCLSFYRSCRFSAKLNGCYLQRFTDDPDHDPYAASAGNCYSKRSLTPSRYSATHGLLYSHMGWIFFKPKYERLDQVDRQDLEADPGSSTEFYCFALLTPFYSRSISAQILRYSYAM